MVDFTVPILENKPPDAMQRAAERWGSARYFAKWKDGAPRIRAVNTTRCLVCGKNMAYGRGVVHALEHVKRIPPSEER